ncbi:hypothetical protein [Clostridium ihumii]|uniref:hypothetical protein n=1 Tax=Clostridium ihumii TaxID=1470356 RepID=UPI003D325F8C
MKLKEGKKKSFRGWEYIELGLDLEEIEKLNSLKGGKSYESCKSNTIQDFQRKNKNS